MVATNFEKMLPIRSLMSENKGGDDCSDHGTVQRSSSSLTDSILSIASSHSAGPQGRRRQFNPMSRWSVESSMNYIVSKGNQLLEDLRLFMMKEKLRVKELSIFIQAHLEMGKARFSINNVRGAIMSMKHVEKLRVEQRKAMFVIDFLQGLEIDLVTKVEDVQDTKVSLEKIGRSLRAQMSERYSLIAFQLSTSTKIDDQIRAIREENSEETKDVDEHLLAALSK